MLIATTSRFNIWRFFAHNRLRNYTYVLVETATKQAVVIDPWSGEQILTWARGEAVQLIGILNTHDHADHHQGNAALVSAGVPELKSIPWLKLLPVPGHTMDHVAFWLVDGADQHLFVGDTIFSAGVGNCKNGGEPAVLFKTVQKLRELLTEDTVIHCGHDYLERNLSFALSILPDDQELLFEQKNLHPQVSYEMPPFNWGREKQLNPFLRCHETKLKQELKRRSPHLAVSELSDEMCFIQLRQLRDQW